MGMKNVVALLLAAAAGGAVGFSAARHGDQEVKAVLAVDRAVPRRLAYLCKAKSYAAIFEAGPLTKSLAASGGTDQVSIKIEPEAKKLLTVMGAAVETGRPEPAQHQIVENSGDTLVAISFEDQRHVHAFYLDKKTGRLMWTKTSKLLGLKGMSMLFECD
jgi:hypothetical protein